MYILNDTLMGILFHDAHLRSLTAEGDTLRAEFTSAVIRGGSSPEVSRCPLNDGEDRYAAPVLDVTFRGVTDLRILRGGCWQCRPDGSREEIYPPRYLEPGEHPGLLRCIGAQGGDLVFDVTGEDGVYTLSFWLDAGNDYYEITLTAGHTTAQWEHFGGEAWYVGRRQHVSG